MMGGSNDFKNRPAPAPGRDFEGVEARLYLVKETAGFIP